MKTKCYTIGPRATYYGGGRYHGPGTRGRPSRTRPSDRIGGDLEQQAHLMGEKAPDDDILAADVEGAAATLAASCASRRP